MFKLKLKEYYIFCEGKRYIFFSSQVDPEHYTDDVSFVQILLVKRDRDSGVWYDTIEEKDQLWWKRNE